jgi:hypothetical protein
MALTESAVSELLEAFRAGQGVDLIRESVRMVLQELIEAEAAEVIGAACGVQCNRTRRRLWGSKTRLHALTCRSGSTFVLAD